MDLKDIPSIGAVAILSSLLSCGQAHSEGARPPACLTRPSDERIAAALAEFANALESTERYGGVYVAGVNSGCNAATVIYLMRGQTGAHEKQLLATDNGKWFLIDAGSGQLFQIR